MSVRRPGLLLLYEEVTYAFLHLALGTPTSMTPYPLPAQMDHCVLCLHELSFHRKS